MEQHIEKDVRTAKETVQQPRKFTRLLREYMINHKLTLVGVLAPGVACVTDAKLAIHICFSNKRWEPRRPRKLKRPLFANSEKFTPFSVLPFNGSILNIMQYAERNLVPSNDCQWFPRPQKLCC